MDMVLLPHSDSFMWFLIHAPQKTLTVPNFQHCLDKAGMVHSLFKWLLCKRKQRANICFKKISFVPIHCLGCLLNVLTHALRKRMHKLIGYINKSNFNIQAPLIHGIQVMITMKSIFSQFIQCMLYSSNQAKTDKQAITEKLNHQVHLF